MSRDSQTDNDRTGMSQQQFTKAAQSVEIPFQGVPSLQDEADDGGWLEKDEPVGGEPADIPVAGTRGRCDEMGPLTNPDAGEKPGSY